MGLAAPQVGVNVRLMVYNPAGERGSGKEYVLVNPRIVKYGKARDLFDEGCLSFPVIERGPNQAPTVEAEVEVPSQSVSEFQRRVFIFLVYHEMKSAVTNIFERVACGDIRAKCSLNSAINNVLPILCIFLKGF